MLKLLIGEENYIIDLNGYDAPQIPLRIEEGRNQINDTNQKVYRFQRKTFTKTTGSEYWVLSRTCTRCFFSSSSNYSLLPV